MIGAAQSPPNLATPGLTRAWCDGWEAWFQGSAQLLRSALAGELDPLSVPRWLGEMSTRRAPAWASPHEIVFETPIARLRDFSPAGATAVVPTLVLPPQAGHDSCIVDYSHAQSQMRTVIESGLERALALDWIEANENTKDASIADYLEVVDRAVEYCGGHVNLIGDCQGGWLATIYAALHPACVNTLTIAGAPIDFHAGQSIIGEVVQKLAPGGNMWFYEALVAAGGGMLRGDRMLNGFIAINPADEVSRQLELLRNVGDPKYVARYREFEDWFKHTQNIAGNFYLWIVKRLFYENALVNGTLEIDGQRVLLERIEMPLNLLAGARDHITPAAQVFALARAASTPAALIREQTTASGHLGLFMSQDALRNCWPQLLAGVRERS